MTDRARVALLPDETPVGDLGLRPADQRALGRTAPTLGELRELADRELLRLRGGWPPTALAEVRALVPAARGRTAVSAGDEVTIVGRAFTLGAVYAPRAGSHGPGPGRAGCCAAPPKALLPGRQGAVELVPSGRRARHGRDGVGGLGGRAGRGQLPDEAAALMPSGSAGRAARRPPARRPEGARPAARPPRPRDASIMLGFMRSPPWRRRLGRGRWRIVPRCRATRLLHCVQPPTRVGRA